MGRKIQNQDVKTLADLTGAGASASDLINDTKIYMTGAAKQLSAAVTDRDLVAVMVGDSGSGGTKGLVPAPAAGDAAANRFLKADGTWQTAGGGPSFPLQAPDGNAASPSYSFANSTGAGFYRNAADQIGISTNSALKYVISQNEIRSANNNQRTIGAFNTRFAAVYANALEMYIGGNTSEELVFGSIGSSPSGQTVIGMGYNTAGATFQLAVTTPSHSSAGPTRDILIESGNNAGTGNSGNISLRAGTVTSGTRGSVVVNAKSLRLPSAASDPTGVVAGDMYYNTGSNKIKFYNGTTWETITSA